MVFQMILFDAFTQIIFNLHSEHPHEVDKHAGCLIPMQWRENAKHLTELPIGILTAALITEQCLSTCDILYCIRLWRHQNK